MLPLLRKAIASRTLWLFLCLMLLAVGLYVYRDVQPLRCPIKSIWGLPCWGCGLMRVAYLLMEGRVLDAFILNPLSLLTYLLLVLMLGAKFYDDLFETDYYKCFFERKLRGRSIFLLLLFIALYWYAFVLSSGV